MQKHLWITTTRMVDELSEGMQRVFGRGLRLPENLVNLAVIIQNNSLPKSKDNLKYRPLHHFSHVLKAAMTILATSSWDVVQTRQHLLLIKGSFLN